MKGAGQIAQLTVCVPAFLPEVSWRLCPVSMKSGRLCSLPCSLGKRVAIGAIASIKAHFPLLICHSSEVL